MTSIDQIEKQLLNGAHPSEYQSERRPSSTGSTSDNGFDDEDGLYDSHEVDENTNPSIMGDHPSLAPRSGPNTGVKGVRNDAARHAAVQNAHRRDQVLETNKRLENMALGRNRTWQEDDIDRKREAEQGLKPGQVKRADSDDEDDELKMIRSQRLAVLKSQDVSNNARKQKMLGTGVDGKRSRGSSPGRAFGHLREVDADHYAQAIDGEAQDVTVVIHIYVKYVHACAQVTSALSTLARMHTVVKFLQVRAGSIGFGSAGKEVEDEVEADEAAEEIVPTILVYRAGQLIANLVRVDLEEAWRGGEEQNIRDILKSHGVLL